MSQFFFIYKKLKIIKNFFYLKKIFNFFSIINIIKKEKNLFLNFSHLFFFNIFFKLSVGLFFKRSLKKTHYALEFLFKKFIVPQNFLNLKKFFILNIKAFYKFRGFKRIFKNYIKNFNSNLLFINNISFKSHNGIKKKKKKRK